MNKYAIIVAGGSGKRMKTKGPKQFLPLDRIPVLMHTLNKFHEAGKQIKQIVVLPANAIDHWEKLCKKHNFNIPHTVVGGGKTRFHSVRNGLKMVPDEKALVAVHDGVRPWITPALIRNVFRSAHKHGSAIPCLPVNESLRRIKNNKQSIAVDRNSFCLVQTPQCFASDTLKKAYQQKYCKSFTDDASVVEAWGGKVHLTEGEDGNRKITNLGDISHHQIFNF